MQNFEKNLKNTISKYGVLVEPITISKNSENGVHVSWLTVEPRSSSIAHRHQEMEYLVVIGGEGGLFRGNNKLLLSQGMLVTLEPFQEHFIENTAVDKNLVILSFVFEDLSATNNAKHSEVMFPLKKYLITSTPPTPNGDLHVGHIAGPYLKADILKRLIKMHGKEAFHQTGQDDHQSYTAYKGAMMQKTPSETAYYFGKEIQTTLEMADIHIDYFIKPASSHHYNETTHLMFMRLLKNGNILIKNAPSLFCECCDLYLYEAYVTGTCPHCKCISAGGFCENCGQVYDCAELICPTCKICSKVPKLMKIDKAYFPMQPFVEKIRKYHRSINMHPRLLHYCDTILSKSLLDFPVSHLANWGISCQVDALPGQVMNVWFEMGLGLISNMHFLSEWMAEESAVVQCFGFDNSFFNCFLFPAIFMALDKEIHLPRYLLENAFYHLDNVKFSTSRNHLIGVKAFLKEYTSDPMRFYLCYTSPENKSTSFFKSEFMQVTSMLEIDLRCFLNNLDSILSNKYANRAPATGLWDNKHILFYHKIIHSIQIIQNAYHPSSLSLQSVAKILLEMLQTGILFHEAEVYRANIESQQDEYRTSIALELLMIKVFTIAVYPIMPTMGEKLWGIMGFKRPVTWEATPTWIPKGQKIAILEKACPEFCKNP